jgi:hypothetical protein
MDRSVDIRALLPPRCDLAAADVPLASPPRKRWLTYSLRSLILLQLVILLLVGSLVPRLHRFRQQDSILNSNAAGEGKVFCTVKPTDSAWFWQPLASCCGTQAREMTSIRYCSFKLPPITLKEARILASLPYLKKIDLNCDVENEYVINQLCQSRSLESLSVHGYFFDGSRLGWSNIAVKPGQSKLVFLHSSVSMIKEAEIVHLASQFPELEYLSFSNSSITMNGIRPFIKHNRLKFLDVHCWVRPEEYEELLPFTSLKSIRLYEYPTENEGRSANQPDFIKSRNSRFHINQ